MNIYENMKLAGTLVDESKTNTHGRADANKLYLSVHPNLKTDTPIEMMMVRGPISGRLLPAFKMEKEKQLLCWSAKIDRVINLAAIKGGIIADRTCYKAMLNANRAVRHSPWLGIINLMREGKIDFRNIDSVADLLFNLHRMADHEAVLSVIATEIIKDFHSECLHESIAGN